MAYACVRVPVCICTCMRTASSPRPSRRFYFHATACFCLAVEPRCYLPSCAKLLHTWQFIFRMISQKSIRSCKDESAVAVANWCSLAGRFEERRKVGGGEGTPLIILSGGKGWGWAWAASLHALIKAADDLWMNSQLAAASLAAALARSKSPARVERAGVEIPAGRRHTISVGVCLLGDNAKGLVDHTRMRKKNKKKKTSRHSVGKKIQLCCCECVGPLVPWGSAQSKRLCRNFGVTLPLSQPLCAT